MKGINKHLIHVAFPLAGALRVNPQVRVELIGTKSFVFNLGRGRTCTQRKFW